MTYIHEYICETIVDTRATCIHASTHRHMQGTPCITYIHEYICETIVETCGTRIHACTTPAGHAVHEELFVCASNNPAAQALHAL